MLRSGKWLANGFDNGTLLNRPVIFSTLGSRVWTPGNSIAPDVKKQQEGTCADTIIWAA